MGLVDLVWNGPRSEVGRWESDEMKESVIQSGDESMDG